jgi:hypothetical protein
MRSSSATELIILALCVLAFGEGSAEAYVDPGSASYLFQLLAGGVLGAIFLIRTYWTRLVTGVRARLSRDVAGTR